MYEEDDEEDEEEEEEQEEVEGEIGDDEENVEEQEGVKPQKIKVLHCSIFIFSIVILEKDQWREERQDQKQAKGVRISRENKSAKETY